MPREPQTSAWRRAAAFLAAAVPVIIIGFFPLLRNGPVFNTPDETSNYIAAREFAEQGRFSLENELTAADRENLQHPRGFITHEGRAVPMQFLGLPLFWGCAFKLLGLKAWLVVCPALALLFTFYLHRLFRQVAPAASPYAFLFLFAATPLVTLLGRPFLSASLALVLTVPAFDHAIRYARTGSRRQLVLLSVWLTLALLVRPDNIPLALPALYLVISHTHQAALNRRVGRDALIFLLVFTVLFAAPVLTLNTLTYGSPATFGYQLMDRQTGLRGAPAGELGGGAQLLRTARNILFPFEVSLRGAATGVLRYFVLLTPLLFLAALPRLGGLARALRTPGHRWRPAAAVLLAAYLVISRASDGLHGMDRLVPGILDSLARYWMPLYLVLLVAGWQTLAQRLRPAWQTAAALAALVLGLYGLFLQDHQSCLKATEEIRYRSGLWRFITEASEPDAVIYTGISDKYIVPFRTTASWWETQGGSDYEPQRLARSARRVLDLGRPAYLADATVDLETLRPALARQGLILEETRFRENLRAIIEGPAEPRQAVDTPAAPP